MKQIDSLLNSITMYRLVLYGLALLTVLSFLFSFLNILSMSPLIMFISLVVLLASCFASNYILSKLFKVPSNIESNYITAFILFFIFSPIGDITDYLLLALASVIAMASKYILVYKKKHIFNPAALGSFVVGFLGLGASWWIGSEALLIPMLFVGFAVVRKIRRFTMFFSFLVPALIVMLIFGFTYKAPPLETLKFAFTSWPLLFLGTIMLTEPLTTPPTKKLQMIYGGIVGAITAYQLPILNLYVTPEFALLVGNVFSFIVSPKYRLKLTLKTKASISKTTNEFVFSLPSKISYKAGQYMEWTLPHAKADTRGMRRYFTISSSPTEDVLSLGVKKYEPSSTFKKALFDMRPGESIWSGQLKGDFVLPKDKSKKLVFIAGGIGITPFRSMAKCLTDTNDKRDIVLFHLCGNSDEFVYKGIFSKAKNIGLRIVCLDSSKDEHMKEEVVKKEVPDYKDRLFYISGSNAMVHSTKDTLKKLGINNANIMTDYFPGL